MLPTIATGNVGSALAGEYEVANSLRFDDGSTDYLNRTLASDGNRKKWTWSGWIKRGVFTSNQMLFMCQNLPTYSTYSAIQFNDNKIRYFDYNGAFDSQVLTNRLFRDSSAWYHIVIAYDTAQATASNRVKIYVNGSQETSFQTSDYPSQNFDGYINESDLTHYLGTEAGNGNYFDGYMSEVCFIDGQALDPTSFGEFDEDTGIWKPIDVSGLTFGTNGFYLDFENSGSLGADVSGNGNNFTVNNLTSIDQTTDTCTNNYATLNPLLDVNAHPTYSEGNLVFQGTGSTNFAGATILVSSGKWYVEVKATTVNGSYPIIGVIDAQSTLRRNSTYFVAADVDTNNPSGFAVFSNGDIYHNNSSSYGALGTTYTSGDIIGLALDMDSGTKTLGFYKNGSLQTTINLDEPPSGAYMFASGVHSSTSSAKGEFNFGNPTFSITSGNSDGNGYGQFEYSVPSGYYSLNTKNLAEYG